SILLVCVLLPFVPFSVPYFIVAAVSGALSFPLLALHWRKPSPLLFVASILVLTLPSQIARSHFFPAARGIDYWLLVLQYLGIYSIVVFSIIRIFRRQLIEFLDR